MTTVTKAFAYVVRMHAGAPQLLAMISPDHPGYEVVRGHQETGESIEETVVREVAEEAGLTDVQLIRQMGFTTWRNEAQYFFLLRAPDGLPARFVHTVTGSGGDSGRQFAYEWLELSPRLSEQLVEGGNAFVAELIAAIREQG
jgi:ADP-ribose pyrophosphatase YjhB (NUDIX family)